MTPVPCGALMPAELGVISWPREGKGLSVLVDETELPLPDECADRILLVHMLEWSERTRALLRELWRVLAPNGRLLIIVPNRRGLWARVDSTPFGHGRPFSRSQIGTLLKDAMFSPEDWQYALYMPPFSWRVLLKWPVFWERLGLVLWPAFSGVIMVEATKQIYAGVPVKEVRSKEPPRGAGACRGDAERSSSFETGLRPSSGRGLSSPRQEKHRLLAEQVLRKKRHGHAELGA